MLNTFLARCTARTCLRCGAGSFKEICKPCLKLPPTSFETPLGYSVYALGLYQGPAGDFVRRLKYQDETIWASYLGTALAPMLPHSWRNSILVPVPLHPERLAERGYNQAALLARATARASRNPVAHDWVTRTRHTQAQARLGRVDRIENLEGGFSCQTMQTLLSVVVIDDVVTTGNTLDACISALVSAGAEVKGALACAVARASTSHG